MATMGTPTKSNAGLPHGITLRDKPKTGQTLKDIGLELRDKPITGLPSGITLRDKPKLGQTLKDVGLKIGSGGSSSRRAAEQAAAEARRAAEAARVKAAEEQRVREAKDFAEKTRIAKQVVLERQGRAEFKRILDRRSDLIKRGIRERTRPSTDVKTGDKLQVSHWIDKKGNRVTRIVNETRGTTSYSSFERPSGGGNVRQTGGISMGTTPTTKEAPSVVAKDVKVTASEREGQKLVVLKSGQKFRISSTGRVNVGAAFAGSKLEFQDGKLVKVGETWVDGRDVFERPEPSVEAVHEKPSFWKGLQKVVISKRFQSKEVRDKQEKKEERWDSIMNKMSKGQKLNQTDINNFRDIAKITPESIVDKDVAKFAQITGGVVGTFVAPIPGAIMWAMGDTMKSVRESASDGGKITKEEFGKIVLDSATKGAIMGAGMKILGIGGNLISKRVLLGTALRTAENNAIRAALNHGGLLIKFVGRSGKNLISTYFMKDMLGNVFDVTADVKAGRLNNALRKAIETGSAVGGYVGGAKLAKGITGGAIFASGKLQKTAPEFAQKKIPADVMAKQLLSEGKIILTRRGVYETGKGLSPRKDAWLDSKVKNPTKSVFWRFDKTLSKKDEAISPLPLFTKSKTGYLKMFKVNWNKNRGMSPLKRYLKTTAETPLVEDVLIKRIVNLKNIKDLKLRRQIIKEYATKGRLSKLTQDKVLKNNFPISDKNREFGFHDENEFVTRTGFKLKGRKDISWTYDPTLREYIPVVQNLKDAGKIKNFLSFLNKKGIITRTDAKFIVDNYAIKKKFGASSILPNQHSWTHMKQVQNNIIKIMNKYPEFNSYWKRRYGSVANAKLAMKEAMWHDIGKAESASVAFGTPHGEKVWNVWKAGLLPKGIKLTRPVALAIKKHETLDPRRLWYKVQNKVKLISPEEKIVATADRLDLNRVGVKIDLSRLPLKDAIKRLGIKVKFTDYPSKFNSIITKIKLDKGVTKADLKKLFDYSKKGVVKVSEKVRTFKTKKWQSYTSAKSKNSYRAGWVAGRRAGLKPPKNYNAKYKGNQPAYAFGYKEGYDGRYRINYKTGEYKRVTPRPTPRKPGRTLPSRPRRPLPSRPKRPLPSRPTPRKPGRPTPRPPVKPVAPFPFKIPKGFRKKTLSKAQPTYYVVMKRKGKLVKLHASPLVARDARDYLAFRLDRGLGRSAWVEPMGKSKNVLGIPLSMKGYFDKVKHKLRPFKIRRGVKKAIRHGYIERKEFIGDTAAELRELKKARLLAKRKKGKVVRRKAVRKSTKKLIKKKTVRKTPTKKVIEKSKKKKVTRRGKKVIKRKSSVKKKPSKKNVVRKKKK